MDKYIGFDIDSKSVVACVISGGCKDEYGKFEATVGAMKAFIHSQKQDGSRVHVAFEVSGQAGFLYDELSEAADSVVVCNPTEMTWIYRTSKKNDRIDARKMAVLLSIGELPAVYMPSKEIREWRMMILHRKKIVEKAVRAKNRIRALVKGQGISKPSGLGGWWTKRGLAWLEDLIDGGEGGVDLWRVQLGDLVEELSLLWAQQKRITLRLDSYLKCRPAGKLLMSIPGVGPRTAEAVLAYTDDINRFNNYKQYCNYFGLTPKLDESGGMRRVGHIDKKGPSVVRWVLCESSWITIRKSRGLKAFYDRVVNGQAGRKKIAIIAVARKLCAIMRAMLVNGEMFNERLVREIAGLKQAA